MPSATCAWTAAARLSLSGSSAADATFELFGHRVLLPGVRRMALTDVLLANVPVLAARIKRVPRRQQRVTIELVAYACACAVCVFTLDVSPPR